MHTHMHTHSKCLSGVSVVRYTLTFWVKGTLAFFFSHTRDSVALLQGIWQSCGSVFGLSHWTKGTSGILWAGMSIVKCSTLSGLSCPGRNYPGPSAIVLPLQGNTEEETGELRAQESSYSIFRIIKDLWGMAKVEFLKEWSLDHLYQNCVGYFVKYTFCVLPTQENLGDGPRNLHF